MGVIRLEFDSTLDEIADVNMRMVKDTLTYRRQRMQSKWFVGSSVAVAFLFGVLRRADQYSLWLISLLVAAGVGGGLLFAYWYGQFHDWYIRHHYRRMVGEMFRGMQSVHCVFEVRPDMLWTKARDTEVSFNWSALTRVSDTGDAIELWFDPGLAVARNRVFRSEEDRHDFLNTVRSFLRA